MNGANSATNSAAGEISTAVSPDGTSSSPNVMSMNGSATRHAPSTSAQPGRRRMSANAPRGGAAQRDEQHERGERGAAPHDHRRAEVLERVLDQQVRAAPDRGERSEQSDLAGRHASQCAQRDRPKRK